MSCVKWHCQLLMYAYTATTSSHRTALKHYYLLLLVACNWPKNLKILQKISYGAARGRCKKAASKHSHDLHTYTTTYARINPVLVGMRRQPNVIFQTFVAGGKWFWLFACPCANASRYVSASVCGMQHDMYTCNAGNVISVGIVIINIVALTAGPAVWLAARAGGVRRWEDAQFHVWLDNARALTPMPVSAKQQAVMVVHRKRNNKNSVSMLACAWVCFAAGRYTTSEGRKKSVVYRRYRSRSGWTPRVCVCVTATLSFY